MNNTSLNMKEFWAQRAEHYAEASDLETQVRATAAVVTARFAPQHSNILELGCGNAAVLTQIATLRPDLHLVGYDSSPEMIQVAKDRLQKISPTSELVYKPLQTAFFHTQNKTNRPSVILAINTLHNLESSTEIKKTICEMARYVEPDGQIIFDVRNSFNPFVRRGYSKNRKVGLQFFTLSPFFVWRVCSKAGLKIQKIVPFGYTKEQTVNRSNLYRLYAMLSRHIPLCPYYLVITKKVSVHTASQN